MTFDIRARLPKKVKVTELLLRDGLQHERTLLPTETKIWFYNQIVECGYDIVEVTNFGHPRGVVQTRDAEELLRKIKRKPGVKLQCYGMNARAFERCAKITQEGFGPDIMAFTISTTDEHLQRNVNKNIKEYLQEIPELVKISKDNGFECVMAIACVYGCPINGVVPISKTVELIERGLDMGIRKFIPCDTIGWSNPIRTYEYMATLVDKFPDVDCHVAHFHEARGMCTANYFAAIAAGADVVEGSLGALGGQPAFIVDRIVGVGTGPLYTDSDITGNGSTEDVLVMLEEIGVESGVDIDKVLQLGRILEWVLEKNLPPMSTKSGRIPKTPVKWNLEGTWEFIPPYKEGYWAFPKY
jgi:hydroxymethylglutaryl-CoA lyase